MPLIFGTYLAGALLTCLVPITLLICFATYFYRQVRRMPANAAVEQPASTPIDPPAATSSPSPESYSPGT
jgi:hypothetical protein